jgi:hypothetical protein
MTNTLKLLALLGVSPTSICIFVRLRHKILCLLFFSHFRALFSPEHFLSAQAFAVYQRISRQSFVGAFCFFSVKQFYLFSAQLLRSSGGSLMKMWDCKFIFDMLTFSGR